MKVLSLVLVLAASALASAADTSDTAWAAFKAQHGKVYSSAAEEQARRLKWEANARFVEQHNAAHPPHSYTVAMNAFGDLNATEFTALYHRKHAHTVKGKPLSTSENAIPASKDYRQSKCVGPVIDEGQCGSPGLPVVEAVQTMQCLKTGKFVKYSEQQLIDCVQHGCGGGPLSDFVKYCEQVGFVPESDYPSTGHPGTCRHINQTQAVHCRNVAEIPSGNEERLTEALANVGPAVVAVDASGSGFQMYAGGVYDNPDCGTQLDHVLFNVGYGALAGKKYYILQNTWGAAWGVHGYMYLARDANNMCGVASDAWTTEVSP